MPRATVPPLWHTISIVGQTFQLLNLDHPDITARIIEDIDAGVDVYYDRRWSVTERFCHFLLEQPTWVVERSVLILGAGIGLETLVIGRLCGKLYINDLAPAAIELCERQLCHNNITDVSSLPGRYETLDLPPVDLVVGCFLIYNRETVVAMQQFLQRCTAPVLLINDKMPMLHTLTNQTSRSHRFLLPPDDDPCILFT